MGSGSWHAQGLAQLSAAAAADPAVSEGWVFGSAASAELDDPDGPDALAGPDGLDEWSDLDVALVVPPADVLRIASPTWVSQLGRVWTYQTFARDRGSGVRVVFGDGRRVDLVAVTDRAAIPSARRRLRSTPGDHPTAPREDGSLVREAVPDLPALVHEFRFTAALAVVKDARDDLLIGTHLALELPRLCLVVAMSLRDRDAGRSHHRFGGPWNSVVDRVFDLFPDQDPGREGVIDLIDASAGLFDDLAGRMWPDYVPDWSGLTVLLDRARGRGRQEA